MKKWEYAKLHKKSCGIFSLEYDWFLDDEKVGHTEEEIPNIIPILNQLGENGWELIMKIEGYYLLKKGKN